jgi:hypothetical protein
MANYWLLMENPTIAIGVSFLIGFGIAAMFRPLCNGPECIVLHGPPVKDVINKVYQLGGGCVEFTTEVVECPKDTKDIVKTIQRAAAN